MASAPELGHAQIACARSSTAAPMTLGRASSPASTSAAAATQCIHRPPLMSIASAWSLI
jgi:hypothetical protein